VRQKKKSVWLVGHEDPLEMTIVSESMILR
jgi:hypothetical protein